MDAEETAIETPPVETPPVETPPAGDAPPAEGAAVETPPVEQVEKPSPNAARDAIYGRHREQRTAEATADPDRMTAMNVMSGRAAEAPTEAGEDAALAPPPGMVKITVNGKEQFVSQDQALEAGIRTLQKDHSADLKLRNASSAMQLAAERLAEVERRERALKDSGGLPSSGARHDEAGNPPSSQDAGDSAEAVTLAAIKQAQDVLFEDGDTEKATQVMVASSRKAVVEETNRMFVSEFDDIAANPEAFKAAAAMMQQELQKNPSFARIPAIATRIGNLVRGRMLDGKMQEQEARTAAAVQQRQSGQAESRSTEKIRLPQMPARATTRTPTSIAASTSVRLTPNQIVQNMQKARGQLRT